MTESRHTPGPWEIEYDNGDARSLGQWYDVGPARIWVPYNATKEKIETTEANARLIATAPELLEAFKEILPEWYQGNIQGDGQDDPVCIERIKAHKRYQALIAKAEGR